VSDKTRLATAANRIAWDNSAKHHATGASWDALITGFGDPAYSVLDKTLTNALRAAGVRGGEIVQIGCNNGREVLSTLALGARAGLGIDQSRAFLDQGEILTKISGRNCQFLCSDIYALPLDTPNDFDVAFITIGVLNWMPDLAGFFKAVANLLKPGGQLVIYETHPFLEMFDPAADAPFAPKFSYFHTAPIIETLAITYDGTVHDDAPETHWFIHRMSDVLTGCLTAGMQIIEFQEFAHSIREVDYDIYADQDAQLPMSFLLRASKPAS
jgi:SAM-dependent methyltransferase